MCLWLGGSSCFHWALEDWEVPGRPGIGAGVGASPVFLGISELLRVKMFLGVGWVRRRSGTQGSLQGASAKI